VIIALPSPEERKALLTQNANRYPEAFDFTLPTDGGKSDTLKIVLGTPKQDSPGWSSAVAATFKPKTVDADPAALVADCMLWPEPGDWGSVTRRWPALPQTVATVVRRKLGGALSMMESPEGEGPPELVKAAQERNPRVVWRRLRLDGALVELAVQSPDEMVWRMFNSEMAKDGADCWKLALDFATASVADASVPVASLFLRWPGAALLVALTSSQLAGLAAEYAKGEF